MSLRYAVPLYQRLPVAGLQDRGTVMANLALIQARIESSGDIQIVTGAYTAVITDGLVLGDATAGALTVTLPSVLLGAGKILTVKKVDSSVNAVTITAAGSDTIDGAATKVLAAQYASATIRSDGTAWWILATV